MDSSQDSVIAYWNHPGCVDGYDSPHRPGFDRVRYEAAWRSELAQRVPAAPAEVLDPGSGTGFLSLLLAELGHRVRGVDLAGNMLARARRKAAAKGLDITFEKGDAPAPPGEPASVDAVPSGWDPATFRDRAWYDVWIAQYSPPVRRRLPLLERNDSAKVVRLVAEAGFADVRAARLEHIERIVTDAVGDADPDGSEQYVVWARKPSAFAVRTRPSPARERKI